jgi:Uma2 family endonuclease
LRAGDRLARDEFERRYDAMPDVKKAELIEGVVYMPSPVSTDDHGSPQVDLVCWIGIYRAFTEGVQAADNATVRLDWDNDPQPDAFLRILPEYGGRTRSSGRFINGGPEWVGEVTASRVSYDLFDKKDAYRRNGVQEYLVWRVEDRAVDWFTLQGGDYVPRAPGADGIHRSAVFPGLWLDAPALISGNMRRVIEVIQQGVATDEHAEFVKRLAQAHAALGQSPNADSQ